MSAEPVARRDGPLIALLLVLTVGTGLVDAASILALGRVFVANMTGNVVFIGFGLAGAPGFSALGSVVALAGFLVGAVLGGELGHLRQAHRGLLLRDGLLIETLLIGATLVLAALAPTPLPLPTTLLVLAAQSTALGVQNAVVRRLAVPDLTTTVLTMSITGIGSDLRRGDRPAALRRLASVVAMLVGAAIGAVLVLRAGLVPALATQCALLLGVLVVTSVAARGAQHWHRPR